MHPSVVGHRSWLGPLRTKTGRIDRPSIKPGGHSHPQRIRRQNVGRADKDRRDNHKGQQNLEVLTNGGQTAVDSTRHLDRPGIGHPRARHLSADEHIDGRSASRVEPRLGILVCGGKPRQWSTALSHQRSGPRCVLYFIDTPGALISLPLTWAFGPRPTTSCCWVEWPWPAAAQMLCEALSKPGLHSWLAGAAYATTPFVLCELGNGISEVCATQWLPLTLWAAIRAIDRGRWRDWALLGLLQGITSVTTFYYGLTSALLVAPLVGYHLVRRFISDSKHGIRTLKGGALAGLSGGLLVLPHWLIFRASLADPAP